MEYKYQIFVERAAITFLQFRGTLKKILQYNFGDFHQLFII